jgi:hypothetical protein
MAGTAAAMTAGVGHDGHTPSLRHTTALVRGSFARTALSRTALRRAARGASLAGCVPESGTGRPGPPG